MLAKFLFLVLFIGAFVPFFSPVFLEHISNSLDLYFRNFEFNAGIYFIVRNVWSALVGYNPISVLGPLFSVVGLLLILTVVILRRNKTLQALPETWLWIYTIYLMTATTVHPWYLIPLVVLGAISGYLFPMFWSALAFMSYSHYGPAEGLYEPMVMVEYGLVIILILFERKWKAAERAQSAVSA
jgi:hypothetical protein